MRMRAILGMVVKDLRRDVRQPLGLLLTLAFPLLFAGLLAIVFGGDGPLPRVALLVEDRDEDLVSHAVLAAFGAEQMATYFDVEEVGDEGQARIERGEASALLRIPEGFTDAYLRGEPATLELLRNPAQSILPEVAEQIAASLTEVLSAGSFALREPLERLDRLRNDSGTGFSSAAFAEIAATAGDVMEDASARLFPPVITLEASTLDAPEGEGAGGGQADFETLFLWVLPGITVFALFMIGDQIMRDILVEQQAGTLRRQLAGPLGAGTVVAGKVAHTAVVACLSLVILSAVGWTVAERGIDLLGFAVLALALILAVTGTAALIYGVARNERQGATLSAVAFMVFAFVGGSFIQIGDLPAALQRIAPFTPFYWANRGFQVLLQDGGGLVDVLPRVGVLAAIGSIGLVVGSRLLHARLLRAPA
jgi:ABC-2 type transport system permease protein